MALSSSASAPLAGPDDSKAPGAAAMAAAEAAQRAEDRAVRDAAKAQRGVVELKTDALDSFATPQQALAARGVVPIAALRPRRTQWLLHQRMEAEQARARARARQDRQDRRLFGPHFGRQHRRTGSTAATDSDLRAVQLLHDEFDDYATVDAHADADVIAAADAAEGWLTAGGSDTNGGADDDDGGGLEAVDGAGDGDDARRAADARAVLRGTRRYGYDYVVQQPHSLIPTGMGAPTRKQLLAAAAATGNHSGPHGGAGASGSSSLSAGASSVVVKRLHRLNQLHMAMDDRLHAVDAALQQRAIQRAPVLLQHDLLPPSATLYRNSLLLERDRIQHTRARDIQAAAQARLRAEAAAARAAVLITAERHAHAAQLKAAVAMGAASSSSAAPSPSPRAAAAGIEQQQGTAATVSPGKQPDASVSAVVAAASGDQPSGAALARSAMSLLERRAVSARAAASGLAPSASAPQLGLTVGVGLTTPAPTSSATPGRPLLAGLDTAVVIGAEPANPSPPRLLLVAPSNPPPQLFGLTARAAAAGTTPGPVPAAGMVGAPARAVVAIPSPSTDGAGPGPSRPPHHDSAFSLMPTPTPGTGHSNAAHMRHTFGFSPQHQPPPHGHAPAGAAHPGPAPHPVAAASTTTTGGPRPHYDDNPTDEATPASLLHHMQYLPRLTSMLVPAGSPSVPPAMRAPDATPPPPPLSAAADERQRTATDTAALATAAAALVPPPVPLSVTSTPLVPHTRSPGGHRVPVLKPAGGFAPIPESPADTARSGLSTASASSKAPDTFWTVTTHLLPATDRVDPLIARAVAVGRAERKRQRARAAAGEESDDDNGDAEEEKPPHDAVGGGDATLAPAADDVSSASPLPAALRELEHGGGEDWSELPANPKPDDAAGAADGPRAVVSRDGVYLITPAPAAHLSLQLPGGTAASPAAAGAAGTGASPRLSARASARQRSSSPRRSPRPAVVPEPDLHVAPHPPMPPIGTRLVYLSAKTQQPVEHQLTATELWKEQVAAMVAELRAQPSTHEAVHRLALQLRQPRLVTALHPKERQAVMRMLRRILAHAHAQDQAAVAAASHVNKHLTGSAGAAAAGVGAKGGLHAHSQADSPAPPAPAALSVHDSLMLFMPKPSADADGAAAAPAGVAPAVAASSPTREKWHPAAQVAAAAAASHAARLAAAAAAAEADAEEAQRARAAAAAAAAAAGPVSHFDQPVVPVVLSDAERLSPTRVLGDAARDRADQLLHSLARERTLRATGALPHFDGDLSVVAHALVDGAADGDVSTMMGDDETADLSAIAMAPPSPAPSAIAATPTPTPAKALAASASAPALTRVDSSVSTTNGHAVEYRTAAQGTADAQHVRLMLEPGLSRWQYGVPHHKSPQQQQQQQPQQRTSPAPASPSRVARASPAQRARDESKRHSAGAAVVPAKRSPAPSHSRSASTASLRAAGDAKTPGGARSPAATAPLAITVSAPGTVGASSSGAVQPTASPTPVLVVSASAPVFAPSAPTTPTATARGRGSASASPSPSASVSANASGSGNPSVGNGNRSMLSQFGMHPDPTLSLLPLIGIPLHTLLPKTADALTVSPSGGVLSSVSSVLLRDKLNRLADRDRAALAAALAKNPFLLSRLRDEQDNTDGNGTSNSGSNPYPALHQHLIDQQTAHDRRRAARVAAAEQRARDRDAAVAAAVAAGQPPPQLAPLDDPATLLLAADADADATAASAAAVPVARPLAVAARLPPGTVPDLLAPSADPAQLAITVTADGAMRLQPPPELLPPRADGSVRVGPNSTSFDSLHKIVDAARRPGPAAVVQATAAAAAASATTALSAPDGDSKKLAPSASAPALSLSIRTTAAVNATAPGALHVPVTPTSQRDRGGRASEAPTPLAFAGKQSLLLSPSRVVKPSLLNASPGSLLATAYAVTTSSAGVVHAAATAAAAAAAPDVPAEWEALLDGPSGAGAGAAANAFDFAGRPPAATGGPLDPQRVRAYLRGVSVRGGDGTTVGSASGASSVHVSASPAVHTPGRVPGRDAHEYALYNWETRERDEEEGHRTAPLLITARSDASPHRAAALGALLPRPAGASDPVAAALDASSSSSSSNDSQVTPALLRQRRLRREWDAFQREQRPLSQPSTDDDRQQPLTKATREWQTQLLAIDQSASAAAAAPAAAAASVVAGPPPPLPERAPGDPIGTLSANPREAFAQVEAVLHARRAVLGEPDAKKRAARHAAKPTLAPYNPLALRHESQHATPAPASPAPAPAPTPAPGPPTPTRNRPARIGSGVPDPTVAATTAVGPSRAAMRMSGSASVPSLRSVAARPATTAIAGTGALLLSARTSATSSRVQTPLVIAADAASHGRASVVSVAASAAAAAASAATGSAANGAGGSPAPPPAVRMAAAPSATTTSNAFLNPSGLFSALESRASLVHSVHSPSHQLQRDAQHQL